jgi:hypothetical protein
MTELRAASAFIAKLLAPIAADEEQADTLEHARSLRADARAALRKANQLWIIGKQKVRVAEAAHLLANAAFTASGERSISDPTPFAIKMQQAWQQRIVAEYAQCLIPAPSPVELRWKKRMIEHQRDVPAAVLAVIAADEARLNQATPTT